MYLKPVKSNENGHLFTDTLQFSDYLHRHINHSPRMYVEIAFNKTYRFVYYDSLKKQLQRLKTVMS